MPTFFAENCFFLTGPTACGKTALALEFAREENAEILSMDSVAIYRGMDIGSAKPTLAEQAQAVHHMIDLVDPSEEFSVVEYLHRAESVVRDCLARGKKPLFTGGTPLYLKALIFGLFEGPEGDESFRESMRTEAQKAAEAGDRTFLHRKLEAVDPVTAARLHPNDTKRLIRALEVFTLTGKPIHEFQTQFQPEVPERFRERIRIIDIPRPDLHIRIEKRVDLMFELGFLEEVLSLRLRFPVLSRTASMAVGYREILAFLETHGLPAERLDGVRAELGILQNGGAKFSKDAEDWIGREVSRLRRVPEFDVLVMEIKTHTRQMAKRQVTWFRSLLDQEFMF